MSYKLVYLARRAKTVKREDWPRTWKSHAVFASQFPVLEARIDWMRYCNRLDTPELPEFSGAHDGVAVAASDDLAGLTSAGFSDAERKLIEADELSVFDMLTPNFTWYCREQPILAGEVGEVAVFSFLARKPEIDREAFEARWCGRGADVARSAIRALGSVTRYVHNRPLGEPLPLFPFDGITECWFASAQDAIRALQHSEINRLREDMAEYCDLTRSEIMLTEVCHRWPRARTS